MTSSGGPLLWDKDNLYEQELVLQSVVYKDLLNPHRVALCETVDPRPLWTPLRQLEAISGHMEEELILNATRYRMVERLIDYINAGPTWRLHAFLHALCLTNQPHIVSEVLELDPQDYEVQDLGSMSPQDRTGQKRPKKHFFIPVGTKEQHWIPERFLRVTLQHCDSYVKNIMQTSIFGFEKTKMINVTQCFVEAKASFQITKKDHEIGKKQFFTSFLNYEAPNTVKVEGPAGGGKSTLMDELAYSWAKEFLECHADESRDCKGHEWKFVVYIPSGSMKTTAREAVTANIRCQVKKDREYAANAIFNVDGSGVLLMYDAIDELRNRKLRKDLSEFTKECQKNGHPKVFISARSGLCHVADHCFNRSLNLKGFTLEQGVSYVKRYFIDIHGEPEDHPVLRYVERNMEQLEAVLSNPLRVHIFSQLTVSGKLTLDKLEKLSTIRLLKCLESYMVRRDREQRLSSKPSDSGEAENFYKLCMECLLKNIREIPEEMLLSFGVKPDSPYRVFLATKHDFDDFAEDVTLHAFQHEMLFEYFSVCGLINFLETKPEETNKLLLYLCSDADMRNTLVLMCGFISEFKPQFSNLITTIIRASLILQYESETPHGNEVSNELIQLRKDIEQKKAPDCLIGDLDTERCMVLINDAFETESAQLRAASWFIDLHVWSPTTWPKTPVLEYVTKCLQQCKGKEQESIYERTIECLLPCHRFDTEDNDGQFLDVAIFPMGNMRWGIANERKDINILAWCPADVGPTLRGWFAVRQPDKPHTSVIGVDLNACSFIWGRCPTHLTTPPEWGSALREVLPPGHGLSMVIIWTYINPPTPQNDLLQAIQEVVQPGHGISSKLVLWSGQVGEEELLGWLEWCKSVKLVPHMQYMTVVLTKNHRPEDIPEVDALLKQKVLETGDTGRHILPSYVSHDGEVLAREYDPNKEYPKDSDSEDTEAEDSQSEGAQDEVTHVEDGGNDETQLKQTHEQNTKQQDVHGSQNGQVNASNQSVNNYNEDHHGEEGQNERIQPKQTCDQSAEQQEIQGSQNGQMNASKQNVNEYTKQNQDQGEATSDKDSPVSQTSQIEGNIQSLLTGIHQQEEKQHVETETEEMKLLQDTDVEEEWPQADIDSIQRRRPVKKPCGCCSIV